MNQCLDEISKITLLHQKKIIDWKAQGLVLKESGLLGLVEENHAFNFQLWHAEDKARREDKGPEFVYRAKREIDHFNQQRNNRMEGIDTWLSNQLKPADTSECTLHSETPGMIIDRLSILSLKIYHMHEQAQRKDANSSHRDTCLEKFYILERQKNDLNDCLSSLIEEIINKERTFKIYYQLKMYNDPKLNPELYKNSQAKTET